jgi:hypothetical protein
LIEGTGTEPDEEILKNDRSKVFTRCWVAVAQDRRYREESCDVMEEKDQGGGDGTEESDKWAAFQRGMPMAAFAPPVQLRKTRFHHHAAFTLLTAACLPLQAISGIRIGEGCVA